MNLSLEDIIDTLSEEYPEDKREETIKNMKDIVKMMLDNNEDKKDIVTKLQSV